MIFQTLNKICTSVGWVIVSVISFLLLLWQVFLLYDFFYSFFHPPQEDSIERRSIEHGIRHYIDSQNIDSQKVSLGDLFWCGFLVVVLDSVVFSLFYFSSYTTIYVGYVSTAVLFLLLPRGATFLFVGYMLGFSNVGWWLLFAPVTVIMLIVDYSVLPNPYGFTGNQIYNIFEEIGGGFKSEWIGITVRAHYKIKALPDIIDYLVRKKVKKTEKAQKKEIELFLQERNIGLDYGITYKLLMITEEKRKEIFVFFDKLRDEILCHFPYTRSFEKVILPSVNHIEKIDFSVFNQMMSDDFQKAFYLWIVYNYHIIGPCPLTLNLSELYTFIGNHLGKSS